MEVLLYICSLPFSYAAIFTSDTALICFVFITPIIAFIILLPSFRKKHLSSVLVVILCLLTGLGTTCAYVSSSWVTGETEVKVPITPKGHPMKSLVGFWVGLWHAKITHITDDNHTTHYVTWISRAELVGIHKTALKEGWPLPLVSLTAEISGEGLAWRGVLGNAVIHAGSMTSYILIAAMYSWAVWVVILMICPELSCWPLIITGTLTAISSLHYLGCAVYYFPEYVLVEGMMTKLRFGWAWWLMGCISVILAIVGVVLTMYDHMYPGKLGAMFILDFYTESDALSGAPELLYAYDSVVEKHSHLYPLSVNNFLYGNKKISNKNLLGKNCENRTLEGDTGNRNTFSDAYDASNIEIAGKAKEDLVQYVNETEKENEIGNENETKTSSEINGKNETFMSPITVINSLLTMSLEKQRNMATLWKRTPPEKSLEPQNDKYNYTTVHKGKTIIRKFSAPIMVPQANPRPNGRTLRKSFSKVHSKLRPTFSPKKPSKVNLISAPKLDKSELSNNTS
ncbi:uncharacterized protein [Macrobrachium rosenbergii]|uniref:uncharacterized protein n=1 Tax=Macrobrachium rosenbergii TaxID=79674 RepID=UPI0034D63D7E